MSLTHRIQAAVRNAPGATHAILLLLSVLILAPAAAAEFTFAALGDAPYDAAEEQDFLGVLAELNREPLEFVVHVGDFKSGRSPCSDELFEQRRQWFELSHHPFVFVPGDNEWVDCRRTAAGGYSALERLQRLRELFFARPQSLGARRLPLARQPEKEPSFPYPEHARWEHGGVMFATLNVPGGDNNFAIDREEFRMRDPAVRSWVRAAFGAARSRQLRAVVLFMQANPWSAAGPRRHGFAPLIATLAAETMNFQGEVVLIHGDTHRHRVDRPLAHPQTRQPLRNFTRVEVFGSPGVNWVRVRVITDAAHVRFEVTPGN